MELFGSSLLYLIGDNFDAQELQKSISKKAENEIVLSPAGGRVDDAQIELDRPARPRRSKPVIDEQSSCITFRNAPHLAGIFVCSLKLPEKKLS